MPPTWIVDEVENGELRMKGDRSEEVEKQGGGTNQKIMNFHFCLSLILQMWIFDFRF